MDAKLVANYLTTLKEKSGFTFEDIAEKSGRSVSTVKNLCSGKSEDPRLDTVAPVIYAVGGSLDEMYNPGKSKDALKEISISSIKEMYERHIADLKEGYDKHLADKDEIIKEKNSQATFLKVLACVGLAILVGLLIIEVMHPDLGWIRF